MRDLDDYVARAARAELGPRLIGRVPAGADSSGCETARFDLNLDGFAALHPALAAALLRDFLARRIGSLRGFTRRHIEAVRQLCLGESPSAALDLPGGWRVERRYAALVLERRVAAAKRHRQIDDRRLAAAAERFDVSLAREGLTRVQQVGFVFHSEVVPADAAPMPVDLYEACFDADRADPGLAVRTFLPGDRISPLGIEGSRKLQDIFVDHKLERSRRRAYPVVTLEGQVAWLPGLARGRIALVTAETIRVLRLHAFAEAMLT
jgi:tRNA(Ile)-lysidine synthase